MGNLYTLLKADEKQIRKLLVKELTENGYKPIVNDDFIYAEGTVPVMLVAHYDTIPKQPKHIINNNGILSAKHGLGADDRAGIYGILELIKNHHCHVLFTGGEEKGGIGAEAFVKSGIKPKPLNYIIELDRRGSNDAVYYFGDNEEFEEFITSFGWKTAYGTYTDICELAPALGVSAVNLSIGYEHEHTAEETLDTKVMNANIARIPKMLDGKYYEWKEEEYYSKYDRYGWYSDYDEWYILYEANGVEYMEAGCGTSEAEVVGQFLMDNPSLCYNDIVYVMTADEYSDWGYLYKEELA